MCGEILAETTCSGALIRRTMILLTPATTFDDGVETKLETNADQIAELRYLGGLNAVSQTVRDAAEAAIE